MSDLQSKFEAAVTNSKTLSAKPDNATLLKIYSLYKQATNGDAGGKRPGMFDPVGRAKYDAWAELKGTTQDDAKEQYTALVEGLQA